MLLIAAALVPLTVGNGKGRVEIAKPPSFIAGDPRARPRPRDDDLRLYDSVIARIARGQNYYDVVVAEHRRAHYPVRPGLAVRMPTLAYLDAALGVKGDALAPAAIAAALALLAATCWAWWRRLGEEPCEPAQRWLGTALMLFDGSLGLNRYFFVLHELWAGMLIALAFGLHRPSRGKFLGAWLAAALALAIREQTLPFVLLLGAYAVWRRAQGQDSGREAAAWGGLVVLFALGLAWHLHAVAVRTLPSDPLGPSWFALRGLGGALANIVLSSNLRFLPHWLAGPLVILSLLGWAGWKSPAGGFGALLYLGYGAAFMVAGRDDNFYWGAIIAPAMFVGLAFAPMAAKSLFSAALGR